MHSHEQAVGQIDILSYVLIIFLKGIQINHRSTDVLYLATCTRCGLKKERKVIMLWKHYLLKNSPKTEHILPLSRGGRNSPVRYWMISLSASVCYTKHARELSVPYLFFATDLYQRQREQFPLQEGNKKSHVEFASSCKTTLNVETEIKQTNKQTFLCHYIYNRFTWNVGRKSQGHWHKLLLPLLVRAKTAIMAT